MEASWCNTSTLYSAAKVVSHGMFPYFTNRRNIIFQGTFLDLCQHLMLTPVQVFLRPTPEKRKNEVTAGTNLNHPPEYWSLPAVRVVRASKFNYFLAMTLTIFWLKILVWGVNMQFCDSKWQINSIYHYDWKEYNLVEEWTHFWGFQIIPAVKVLCDYAFWSNLLHTILPP